MTFFSALIDDPLFFPCLLIVMVIEEKDEDGTDDTMMVIEVTDIVFSLVSFHTK